MVVLVASLDRSVAHHSIIFSIDICKGRPENGSAFVIFHKNQVCRHFNTVSVTLLVMFLKLGQYDAEQGC
jgi:hypothetical protein